MLMGFSVSNYKTFPNTADNATNQIGFVAGRARSKPEHIFKDTCDKRSILKTSVILGANSSGKSNLVSAIYTLKTLVTSNNWQKLIKNEFKNVKLASFFESNQEIPIKFSITFKTKTNSDDFLIERTLPKGDETQSQAYRYELSLKEKGYWDDRELVFVSESLYLLDYNAGTETPIYESYDDQCEYAISGKAISTEGIMKKKQFRKKIEELNDKINSIESNLAEKSTITFNYELEKKCDELTSQLKLLDNKIEKLQAQITKTSDIEKGMALSEELMALIQMRERVKQTSLIAQKDLESEAMRFNNNSKEVMACKSQLEDLKEQKELILQERDRVISDHQVYTLSPLRNKTILYDGTRGVFGMLRKYAKVNPYLKRDQFKTHCNNVFRWFNQTLEVISPMGSVFPPMGPNRIERLSPLISEMDVHIKKIGWVEITDIAEINSIIGRLSRDDLEKVKLCHNESIQLHSGSTVVVSGSGGLILFDFWNGERIVKKLATFHEDMAPRNLEDESAGTKRLIQLSSILLEPNEDKVYVVDELDAKIHPKLIRAFVESFINQSSEHKQLIFTTHDTRLLTTELFRTDEIWFIERVDGYSTIKSLDDMKIKLSDKLEKEYLSGKLGGIPRVS